MVTIGDKRLPASHIDFSQIFWNILHKTDLHQSYIFGPNLEEIRLFLSAQP